MKVAKVKMMDQCCEKYFMQISKYIDNDLSENLCKEVEDHLTKCENCNALYESIIKTIGLYRVMDEEIFVSDHSKQKIADCINCNDQIKNKL